MKRFRRLPLSLYRIQGKLPVSLRDYDSQLAKNRSAFDLKLVNNLVQPMLSDTFHTPNGMSLRPAGEKMIEVLKQYKGEAKVFRLHEGVLLPPNLVVLHEHTDHYSLQTTEPIELPKFNQLLSEYLLTFPSSTKEQFLEEYFDEDDQDG
mmetsp:Transcript_7041/g.10461  ORF Transcript_7041/g.10461 Transcript_7041/m.10461 type:complete len:149 (-) Transcript_7041:98-544(-)